ncbi:hypothetical protein EIK77_003437 [Talaromyces pinophilus]|jgi:hypothetical protein|uniref:Mitochondrial ribosomal protein MRP51 n=1 Tax=Talaromyces pinophilus TaxID=128442 RepID=A0A6V8H9Z7_TALPI|nr:hypothetical protein EIK77_003437 [Talaromyces pinophilus]GAM36954.1 hypothetical protein TCE0_022f06460 [Talaromyces pinophilus]
MAAPKLSPTANLLRNSRLFALPTPLTTAPRPVTSKSVNESSSATLPHPTRAAIETPPSALYQGDWGLKRALPAKSTIERSSKPVIRVNALDTFEHVTDFDSAGDHTMTLTKFQELHLPVSLPQSARKNVTSSYGKAHESPFELRYDNVSTSEGAKERDAKLYRQSGPWLGGQSEIQFQAYLQSLRRRRPELLKQLREQYENKLTVERRSKAQDEGGLDADQTIEPVKVTDEEFQTYLKRLRTDKRLAGPELSRLLDLHTLSSDLPQWAVATVYYEATATNLASVAYASQGPPRTHPSAGLAYTRSGAMLYNHPSYGPQQAMRPVEARVLTAKTRKRRYKRRPVFGVAGIAYEDQTESAQDSARGVEYLDPSIPGGGKVLVHPKRVSISSQGTISLEAVRAEKDTMAPYGLSNYDPSDPTNISPAAQSTQRDVPRLD